MSRTIKVTLPDAYQPTTHIVLVAPTQAASTPTVASTFCGSSETPPRRLRDRWGTAHLRDATGRADHPWRHRLDRPTLCGSSAVPLGSHPARGAGAHRLLGRQVVVGHGVLFGWPGRWSGSVGWSRVLRAGAAGSCPAAPVRRPRPVVDVRGGGDLQAEPPPSAAQSCSLPAGHRSARSPDPPTAPPPPTDRPARAPTL